MRNGQLSSAMDKRQEEEQQQRSRPLALSSLGSILYRPRIRKERSIASVRRAIAGKDLVRRTKSRRRSPLRDANEDERRGTRPSRPTTQAPQRRRRRQDFETIPPNQKGGCTAAVPPRCGGSWTSAAATFGLCRCCRCCREHRRRTVLMGREEAKAATATSIILCVVSGLFAPNTSSSFARLLPSPQDRHEI
jgi:hypothetical protein